MGDGGCRDERVGELCHIHLKCTKKTGSVTICLKKIRAHRRQILICCNCFHFSRPTTVLEFYFVSFLGL